MFYKQILKVLFNKIHQNVFLNRMIKGISKHNNKNKLIQLLQLSYSLTMQVKYSHDLINQNSKQNINYKFY